MPILVPSPPANEMSAACERTADGAGDDTSLLSRPFETLTQMDDIRKSLRLLDEEETRIDKSLDDMLAQEAELEDVLGILDVLRPQLGNLKIEASHLVNTIQDTSHLAENISDKVRKLDQEQSRTKEAIQFVEGVQELKHCVAGIQYAIQRKNYDEAASLLQRASRIDNTILNSSLAEFTTPTSEHPDHPAKTLSDAKNLLLEIFSNRFDDAVFQRNEADITRYFKLFPLIGCQTEGLDKYSRFVCQTIKARCAEELKAPASTSTYFADALTRLFEHVALIIDQHQPLVEAHYGQGTMLRVIQQLQEESDTQSGLILDRFLQIRKLESKLVEIQSLNISLMRSSAASRINPNAANASSPVNDAANELVEPRQLDANLLELSLISQRGALFQSFLHERANDDLNNIDEDGTARRIMMNGKDKRYYGDNGLLLTSGLRKRVRELLNSYLVIDAFLMKRNIDKAMTMDEYDPSIAPTSTCVDDVFFILKKVIKRSISTYEPEVITSTVQTVLKTLDNLYIQTFQQKMSMAFAGQELTGRSADRSLDQAKISYMIVLNNLDVSTEYTERLVADLRQDVAAGIWANEKKDMEAATKALDNLAAISKKFQNLLQSRMEQLMAQMLKPRVRPLFQDAYREVKYVLDEEEYNEVEVEELFIKRFRQGFNTLILLYHRTLTENNFRLLLSLLLDVVSVQWEKIVLQTRFNQYGALRFDKDLRTAIHFLSGLTDWLYRDRFTRLSQMATLLNFEEPSEIYECWGAKAGPVSWRLTVTEVKKVLALRLDFDNDEVLNLSL